MSVSLQWRYPSALSHAAPRGPVRRDVDAAPVVPLHTVRGRARLHVSRLYRDELACAALAQQLCNTAGIVNVRANAWTGNIVVLFDSACSLDAIIACTSAHGGETRASAPAARASGVDEPVVRPDFGAHVGRAHAVTAPAGATPAGLAGRPWHTVHAREALLAMGSTKERGLSHRTARRRLLAHGPNQLDPPRLRSALEMFVAQFKSLPVALLAGSAIVSIATGGLADALVIASVVLINGAIGYATESQAERAIHALDDMTQRQAMVLRDAELHRVDARELVVGDILVLTAGVYIGADARVVDARQLSADESTMTGESLPAQKSPKRLRETELPLAERTCMVYMGTTVVSGSGLAMVVAVGRATELGMVQVLVGSTRPPATPMQRQLQHFGNQTVRLASAMCALVFAIGTLRGLGLGAMFKSSVALAVAAVPEGLPTVATTTLALGIRRMRRHNVLVRRLDAVETLGAVHTVCFDKTGTLTVNRMRVLAMHAAMHRSTVAEGRLYAPAGRIEPLAQDAVLRLLHVAVLCNEARIDGGPDRFQLNGSSTELALLEFALAATVEVDAVRARHPLLAVAYRTDERNYMSTLHGSDDGGRLLAVKGNPAEVLALCGEHAADGHRLPLTDADRESILAANLEMGGEGLRLLGFAYATGDGTLNIEARPLCWLGMLGLADPIRNGAQQLVDLFRHAGIKTAMITGDQAVTAHAVGKALGMGSDGGPEVVEARQIAGMKPGAFARLAQRMDIFARVSAANKLQIVQGLQSGGQVVAMVGDGVNDGPALKAADISVAMGRHSTDLAREVADVVLEDDELQTLAVAISQGRAIYSNIRKSVHFLVSTNLSEIVVMLAAVGVGVVQPLTPMQLLWINLLSDVFPALALAMEPPEPDVLRIPPRDAGEPIVGRSDMSRFGIEALAMSGGAIAAHAFAAARHGAGPAAGTVSFMTLTLGQLLHAYNCRSDSRGMPGAAPAQHNRYLDFAVGGGMALQLLAGVIPGLRSLLRVAPVDALDLAAIAAGAAVPYWINGTARRRDGGLLLRSARQ
ncbi:cation-translocating P-type ATPase [Cupriavidus necator]|uniref:cation-translocating P-type ATPase n=1 Tax=Cupriavidus necator TaxID=106590 RepID=UPI002786030A|nr:cation-transporting P-type ATPase [Cupriavidus necator]MDQ0138532.1 Ca2+-transporting ATPase [Cupriavidus necator]